MNYTLVLKSTFYQSFLNYVLWQLPIAIADDWICYLLVLKHSPRIATTMSSLRISMEPRDKKYSAVRTSPQWTRVSPGGAWVVLNFIARALRQPLLAPRKALQFCSRVWLRCRQMSACKHSGKPFRTWRRKIKNFILPAHCVVQSDIKFIFWSRNCRCSNCHQEFFQCFYLAYFNEYLVC